MSHCTLSVCGRQADDYDDDIFKMGDSADEEPPASKGKGKAKAPVKRGGKATAAKGKGKAPAAASTPLKAKVCVS